jgi:hypothetical protein
MALLRVFKNKAEHVQIMVGSTVIFRKQRWNGRFNVDLKD